jgi:hypothetical protein
MPLLLRTKAVRHGPCDQWTHEVGGGDEDLWSSTSAEPNAMLPHAARKQTCPTRNTDQSPDVHQCAANLKTKPAERWGVRLATPQGLSADAVTPAWLALRWEVGGWEGLELHLNLVIPTFTWETWLHTVLLRWSANTRERGTCSPLLFNLWPDTWVTDRTTGESALNFRAPGRDIDHPSAYSAEVKKCVAINLHSHLSSRVGLLMQTMSTSGKRVASILKSASAAVVKIRQLCEIWDSEGCIHTHGNEVT